MDKNDKSYEPMDIDLSAQSVSAMDISYTEPNISSINCSKDLKNLTDENIVTDNCLNLKPLNINDLIEKKTQNRTKVHKKVIRWLSYILILIISIITYQVASFTCSEKVNSSLLRNVFASRVFGQVTATESLLKALETDASRKIIILYGGTGVGKTYISSIILESLFNHGNIYHYTMPGFSQTSSDFMLGLIFCNSTMLIIDDLKENDISKIDNTIKDYVDKSEKNSKDLTIMLLFSIEMFNDKFQRKHDEIFLQKLQQSIRNINAQKFYIKLKTLTDSDLRRCILNEFPNKKFSESAILAFMKNFNVTIDGCKGVYQKMKYLSLI